MQFFEEKKCILVADLSKKRTPKKAKNSKIEHLV